MENKIGNTIKEARINKGLTLQEVADEIGCSASYIHRIESGARKGFNYQIYSKLTELLDIENPEDIISKEKMSEFEQLIKNNKEARLKLKFTIDTAFESINKVLEELELIEEEMEEKMLDIIG